jgi:toxin secretion/phage lysis holin
VKDEFKSKRRDTERRLVSMAKEEIVAKTAFTSITAFTTYLTGMFTEVLIVLIAVQVWDYSTGCLRGVLTGTLNSTIGLKGILKKIGMLMIVGLAGCVEFVLLSLGMNTHNGLVVTVICFFIVNESISCLENAAQLGVPIPRVLYEALAKLREVGGKEQKVARPRKPKPKA